MRKKITAEMIEFWIGDGFEQKAHRHQVTTLQSCLNILADIANGKYKPTELREDVTSCEYEA